MLLACFRIASRFRRNIKKKGANRRDRQGKHVRCGLTIGSQGILVPTWYRAALQVRTFLSIQQPLHDIHHKFGVFRRGVVHIQSSFKQYFSFFLDRLKIIKLFLKREIKRICFACSKQPE